MHYKKQSHNIIFNLFGAQNNKKKSHYTATMFLTLTLN